MCVVVVGATLVYVCLFTTYCMYVRERYKLEEEYKRKIYDALPWQPSNTCSYKEFEIKKKELNDELEKKINECYKKMNPTSIKRQTEKNNLIKLLKSCQDISKIFNNASASNQKKITFRYDVTQDDYLLCEKTPESEFLTRLEFETELSTQTIANKIKENSDYECYVRGDTYIFGKDKKNEIHIRDWGRVKFSSQSNQKFDCNILYSILDLYENESKIKN